MDTHQKQFDYLVFIGRVQPLHIGHCEVISAARRMAKQVIVLIGSSNQPRTPKNPFTYEERKVMIENHFGNQGADWLCVRPLRDKPYNDQQWATQVQQAVAACIPWSDVPLRGGIIGHRKDASTFYLDMFPQWGDPIEHGINELVNATDVRALYLEKDSIRYIENVVPKTVFDFLTQFKTTSTYKSLIVEHEFLKQYNEKWSHTPYPVIFQTGDAVVIQSGHILLVKRGGYPGHGLLALPGGFVNPRERVLDGIVRELREETRLKVPEKVLRGCVKKLELFDAPGRSLRGRTITHAALIELDSGKLPPAKGGDDAHKAFWMPLSHVREEEMFEDHYAIIDQLVGL